MSWPSLTKKLVVAILLSLTHVSGASLEKRYVLNLPGNALPFGLSASVVAAKGRLVRTFPQIGVAIAVSSSPVFTSSLSRILAVPLETIGRVPASRVPGSTAYRKAAGVLQTDTAYHDGSLWGIRRVGANQAWSAGFTGSHRTVVAVIDTGIAWNHPDLRPNIVLTKCFSSGATCSPYPSLSGHGTHVAGIIAAAFGGGSVVGVGPNLGLASYNIFEEVPDCGVCSYEDSRWAAMTDAADRGFAVINVSQGTTYWLGGDRSNDVAAYRASEKRVVDYVIKAGTVVVASAGNSNADLTGPTLHLPGDVPGYINAGATAIRPGPRYPAPGAYDVRAYYSNYGSPVTVSAPGGDCGSDNDCDPLLEDWFRYSILSTVVYADPFCAATADCAVDYEWKAGTSMAAAHISGVAGLVRDARRDLKPHQVIAVLKSTADSSGSRYQFGHGIVNALAAVRNARSK